MKLKKGILFTVILFLTIAMLSVFSQVKAATGSLYLNLKMIRNQEDGYGYQLGNSRRNIWKIYETGSQADDTIYCLKGGPGFGNDDFATGSPQETEYTRYFDLRTPEDIPSTYQRALPSINSDEYEALMWILDHIYVLPKKNATVEEEQAAERNKQMLLEAAAKYADETGNPDVSDIYDFEYLTDEDIDAVQQLAVWYYTNPDSDDPYHVNTFEFYLNAVPNVEGNYQPLSDDLTFQDGNARAKACQALFDYLVQTPQEPGFSYDYQNQNSRQAPVQIANTNIEIQTVGNRLVVGPYRIDEIRDIDYTLEGKFLDGANQEISDVTFLNSSQSALPGNTTLQDLVGQNFYISIPTTTNTSRIEFQISGSFFITTTTYWSVANPSTQDQPVVIVEKEEVPFEDNIIKTETPEPEPEEVFDLALRKFIVSIAGQAPEVDRTPEISNEELSKLENGDTTTANKVHPKDALLVKTGDIVIYTIRVYNEGDIDGYATEVTDYLPAGLTFLPDHEINTQYGWSNPSGDGRTIVTNYLENTLLEAFNGTNLDYADLQIACQVTATVTDEDQSLKNIAEITAHKDKDGNTDVVDRDSTPDNVDLDNYGNTSQEDDDDFEHLILLGQYFDLSLRKFITSVSDGTNVTNYNRAPVVDVTPLRNGTSTTAIYNHPKTPVSVSNGNEVIYTIRVYNEGQLDGYVTEITDHLPEQLEFIVDDELNAKYGWTVSADGRTVTTDITSPNTTHMASRDEIYANRTTDTDKVLLKAFNGETLDYIDVQIKCRVKDNIDLYEKITNIAEISDFTDSEGAEITDRDSQEDNVTLPTDESLPTYKDDEIESGEEYIPGQQDDDDFEKLILRRFDLALRKFITGVNDKEITDRAPVFNKISDTEYEYVHPKDPVEVANGNIVIYTLRIFNEGNVAGYASEVKDDLPEGLEFLPDHAINTAFEWKMYTADGTETTNVEEAEYIKTNYLSKENETTPGEFLIDAFDPDTMTMPDYKDLKIAFKVTEPNTSDRIIINTAEISDDSDEDGNPIDDVDSTPDNDVDGEDDIDIEKIKVLYFDLSLKKWVTESIVTYNGKTTITQTGHTGDENPEPPAKVEIRGSRIDKTTVKFRFKIKVTNEGEIAGYVKELIDYVPEGLEFVAEDNPLWREEDGKILTDQLKDTLLEPGESATVEIVLTWINSKDNLGLKTNWAEIYEDDNEYDSPDIDSTPGNDVEGEDDIDDAPVILSVVTGSAPTYITLALASISMIAGGVVLIKKFVI